MNWKEIRQGEAAGRVELEKTQTRKIRISEDALSTALKG